MLEKRILQVLTSRRWNHIEKRDAVPSAILLLLFEFEQAYYVLLTKRSDKVAYHKGEISFPGGTADPEDPDLLHTALREVHEEIGLMPNDVTILGRLDDILTTTTGFVIAPYVGVIPYPYPFQINSDEIAKLIFVPLDILEELGGVKEQSSPRGKDRGYAPRFQFQGHIIWGATARILEQFMTLVRSTKEGDLKL